MQKEGDFINVVTAEVTHKAFRENPKKEIRVTIERSDVLLKFQDISLHIEITGNKNIDKLEKLLFEILSLLFLCLGGYPRIKNIISNKSIKDISNLLIKYNTSEIFFKESLLLCNIDSNIINETVLKNYRQIKQTPISSLQYLVSKDYESVITNHKITLLLHIIEGLVDSSLRPSLKRELKSKLKTEEKIGNFMAATYHICKHYFFNYHRKYKFDILPLLKVSQNEFLRILTDTRNWYSHYFDETQKLDRLNDGKEIMIYLHIIYFTIRLFLMDSIQVECDESRIREYYYMLHDWILEVKYGKSNPLKSNTYKINKSLKELENLFLQSGYEKPGQ